MITTVTLNPSIDREYFINTLNISENQFIYDDQDLRVNPGGKGLLTAINLKNLGYHDVQNIGFIGGKQGLFFEKMVQEYKITTNYIYTSNEMRNNIKIITVSQHSKFSIINEFEYLKEDNIYVFYPPFINNQENDKEGYLCGSPGMLDACIKVMRDNDMKEDKIYYDKFA